MTDTPLTPYSRPAIPAIGQAQIAQYMHLLKLTPKVKRIAIAAQILQQTMAMAEKAKALRAQRGFLPLKDDPDFMSHFELIEKYASNPSMVNTVLENALLENSLLTLEVNDHHAALGLPAVEPTTLKV